MLGLGGEDWRRRRKGGLERALLAQAMTKHAGLTQREAAVELGWGPERRLACHCAACERRWKKTGFCVANGKTSNLIYYLLRADPFCPLTQ